MKKKLYAHIIVVFLLSLLLTSKASIGVNIDTSSSSIKIDKLTIDIVQKADIKTFKIDQFYYINNTGYDFFNDSFYIWVPDDCKIIGDCCDGALNMGCRLDAKDEMWCFNFNKTEDDNIYVGYPISNKFKLSYYGQEESFTITASSLTNSSIENDTIQLNATIGGFYEAREKEVFEGAGIHITSQDKMIGMNPWMSPYKSFNITVFEQISIFNNGSKNETIELSIDNLPESWFVQIWNSTKNLNNVTLSPQQSINLTLIITAPSYLAEIIVEFTTDTIIDENITQWTFINKYLYETDSVFYQILSTSPEGFNISNDLNSSHDKPYWYEQYGRFWFLASGNNIKPNNESIISLKLAADIPSSTSTFKINPYLLALLVLIIIAIIIVIILRKIDFFKEKELTKDKKETSRKVDKDKKKVQEKKVVEENDKKIKDLEAKKKELLSAIKRVEKEFKDGIIKKEDYEKLRNTYKKQAIKILKEIDRLKE